MNKLLSTLCVVTLAALYGCAPKAVVKPTEDLTAKAAAEAAARAAAEKAAKEGSMEVTDGEELAGKDLNADVIYFPLDSFGLEEKSRAALDHLADSLTAHPNSSVTIAGHTCELGTSEYNLALGQQRARVARDYLVRMGVKADRVNVISYGEEHPAVTGTGEEVWSKNRRDEFTFTANAKATPAP
jgi:peptidoglycan-associated lipoprotein